MIQYTNGTISLIEGVPLYSDTHLFYVHPEAYRQIQRARARAAVQRARDITWMKGNKHIWNPKPTKAQRSKHG